MIRSPTPHLLLHPIKTSLKGQQKTMESFLSKNKLISLYIDRSMVEY